MMTLVVGGSASGKSEYAEGLVLASPGRPRIYIATMQPFDDECRAMRARKAFETVECYTALDTVRIPQGATVLLECMSNLLANEMYSPAGSSDAACEAILRGVRRLRKQCGDLIIVSNEVFSGGSRYEDDTMRYLQQLGTLNCALAEEADCVCEVACGLPIYYKGGEKP